ncbi:unnamed protein product [Rotaria sp. Silwood1]|nr:unnamed protein product [Rotaria sp. Silwood1]CAF5068798.1 unnamed protein product [Rotaria sp. Silwood1]
MATNVLSIDQSRVVYIEIGETKIGRISLPYSTTVAELRIQLSERYSISSSTHFVDSKGYPVSTMDEQTIDISHLLCENDVIKLKTDANISIPEKKKSEVASGRFELNVASSNIKEISAPSKGPTIPGSMPAHSTNTIVMATQLDDKMWKDVFDTCSLLCAIRIDGKEPIRAMHPVLEFKESDKYTPVFQVRDNSYIRAHMRNRRMESCFVSNDYFDGGIDLSCPCIGIGIDSTYKQFISKTNEKRTMYSTCVFNHSRAIVELNLSYLEPTQEFIDAIDNVLQQTPTKDDLKNVFLSYGHVYPQRITLGGHLFYTEEHCVKGNVDEEEIRIAAEDRFKTAYLTQTELRLGSSFGNKSKKESSKQDSSITFEAVGGNTLLARNPTAWEETLSNPIFWRVIEQSEYKSVITLLSKQQQEAISISNENIFINSH